MEKKKRAILVVSFGTSHEETRKKTIEQIERDVQAAYPACSVYRAWTSRMIRKKLLSRDGLQIPDVREALEKMEADGIREVVIQPTHVIRGIEYDRLMSDVLSFQEHFARMAAGAPLLSSREDQEKVSRAVVEAIAPLPREALVLMGHGSEHGANAVYAEMDAGFKKMGYPNVWMGTVEAEPSWETLALQVKGMCPERVILAPFMIVAGDHAVNDLAGKDEDSWKSRFEAAGCRVSCVLKGLGEYPRVREILLEHVADALKILEAEGEQ